MIPPTGYLAELGDHAPPIPAELMLRVYEGYERRKAATRRIDFEDIPFFLTPSSPKSAP